MRYKTLRRVKNTCIRSTLLTYSPLFRCYIRCYLTLWLSTKEQIVYCDISNFNDMKWLVHWSRWDNYETLKDLEAFHYYCATLQLDHLSLKQHTRFHASTPYSERHTVNSHHQTHITTTTVPTFNKRGCQHGIITFEGA